MFGFFSIYLAVSPARVGFSWILLGERIGVVYGHILSDVSFGGRFSRANRGSCSVRVCGLGVWRATFWWVTLPRGRVWMYVLHVSCTPQLRFSARRGA